MKRWLLVMIAALVIWSMTACAARQEETAGVMDMSGASTSMPEDSIPEGMPEGGVPSDGENTRQKGNRTGGTAVTQSGEGSGEAADKLAAGKQGEMPAGGTAHGRSIDADVTGQVDSIIGNEVVLTLGEVENGTFTAGTSGETATYLLPVGMTIGSGDFSSVTSGMVLGLSLNDSGAITAVSVLSR